MEFHPAGTDARHFNSRLKLSIHDRSSHKKSTETPLLTATMITPLELRRLRCKSEPDFDAAGSPRLA
jgi:hypothetical protein